MALDFKLPDLGENIHTGDVVSVLVEVGQTVAEGQGVVEIETDKAVVEVPCPKAGQVTAIHVKPGDTVPIGAVLLTLEAVPAAGSSAPSNKTGARIAASAPAPAPTVRNEPAEAAPFPAARVPDSTEPPAVRAPMAGPARGSGPVPEAPARRSSAPPAAPAPSTSPARASVEVPAGNGHQAGEAIAAGPSIRRLARELGIDLARVEGTGEGGRITREDVISTVRQATSRPAAQAPGTTLLRTPTPPGTADQDAWGTVRREKLTKIRKTIAANMVRSKTTIPHVTNFDDADITELERIRKQSASDYVSENVKLTMMVFVMKAVAHSLRLHPTLNALFDTEAEQIVYKEYVNIGVAVDTPRGLVVPVIRNVDRMSIPQLAYALSNVASQARENRFSIEDLRGGTFTVSNLGAIGGTYSTPIINHPEVAVLLTGKSRKLPVVIEDKVEPRLMMPLSLSYDHRLVDGAAAARFLNEVIGLLQAPGRLLLAP